MLFRFFFAGDAMKALMVLIPGEAGSGFFRGFEEEKDYCYADKDKCAIEYSCSCFSRHCIAIFKIVRLSYRGVV